MIKLYINPHFNVYICVFVPAHAHAVVSVEFLVFSLSKLL